MELLNGLLTRNAKSLIELEDKNRNLGETIRGLVKSSLWRIAITKVAITPGHGVAAVTTAGEAKRPLLRNQQRFN